MELSTIILIGLGVVVLGLGIVILITRSSNEEETTTSSLRGVGPTVTSSMGTRRIYRSRAGSSYRYYDSAGIEIDPLTAIILWDALVADDPTYASTHELDEGVTPEVSSSDDIIIDEPSVDVPDASSSLSSIEANYDPSTMTSNCGSSCSSSSSSSSSTYSSCGSSCSSSSSSSGSSCGSSCGGGGGD